MDYDQRFQTLQATEVIFTVIYVMQISSSILALKKNGIILSRKFCSKMIDDNKGLLYFLNITLIDFLDFVLNFLQCYEPTEV